MILKKISISVALIHKDSSYICLRRNSDTYKNYIEFPGGKLKNNETPSICLIREITEELNINVKKYKFIGKLKHLYNDLLITVYVFKIFKYDGVIHSNENREIVLYDENSSHKILPTHNRIITLLKLPRLLKIVTADEFANNTQFNVINHTSLRLRNINYDFYKRNIKDILISHKYTGNIFIDYPYNLDWKDSYHGIHFRSDDLYKFDNKKKESKIIYSASCHTLTDIELCNSKLFDFILISPVLCSPYKQSILNWSGYSELNKHAYMPTYALGGLSSESNDYEKCREHHGFGIAGISKL